MSDLKHLLDEALERQRNHEAAKAKQEKNRKVVAVIIMSMTLIGTYFIFSSGMVANFLPHSPPIKKVPIFTSNNGGEGYITIQDIPSINLTPTPTKPPSINGVYIYECGKLREVHSRNEERIKEDCLRSIGKVI